MSFFGYLIQGQVPSDLLHPPLHTVITWPELQKWFWVSNGLIILFSQSPLSENHHNQEQRLLMLQTINIPAEQKGKGHVWQSSSVPARTSLWSELFFRIHNAFQTWTSQTWLHGMFPCWQWVCRFLLSSFGLSLLQFSWVLVTSPLYERMPKEGKD